MTFRKLGTLAAVLAGIGLAGPAAAQFDPAFNHLKCYRIKGVPKTQSIIKTLVAENQFGRERIVKLTPVLLCTPTKKTCCSNPANVPGCTPMPCQPDPLPTQPAAVDHFKCYKIGVKFCDTASGAACTTLAKAPKAIPATLINQFGTEDVLIGPAKMLCTPVLKIVTTSSTTTTSTTTTATQSTSTTTVPCHNTAQPGTPAMCAGDCPPSSGLECVFIPSLNDCRCETPCALQTAGTCNGFCPNQGDDCLPDAVVPCRCQPSTTTTTTIPNPCQNVAQPGTAAMCAGSCTQPGFECVFIPSNGQCLCEIPCALAGPAPQVCNNQFCPKQGQQCIANASNPCGCCYPPGGPCTTDFDCCTLICDVSSGICQ